MGLTWAAELWGWLGLVASLLGEQETGLEDGDASEGMRKAWLAAGKWEGNGILCES